MFNGRKWEKVLKWSNYLSDSVKTANQCQMSVLTGGGGDRVRCRLQDVDGRSWTDRNARTWTFVAVVERVNSLRQVIQLSDCLQFIHFSLPRPTSITQTCPTGHSKLAANPRPPSQHHLESQLKSNFSGKYSNSRHGKCLFSRPPLIHVIVKLVEYRPK